MKTIEIIFMDDYNDDKLNNDIYKGILRATMIVYVETSRSHCDRINVNARDTTSCIVQVYYVFILRNTACASCAFSAVNLSRPEKEEEW